MDTLRSIREGVLDFVFKAEVSEKVNMPHASIYAPRNFIHKEFSALGSRQNNDSAPAPVVNDGKKVGRNDPCPCGSGKKYKHCCLKKKKQS